MILCFFVMLIFLGKSTLMGGFLYCKYIIAQRHVVLLVCLCTISCIFRTSKIYCGLFWYSFSCRKKKSKIKGWNMKPWTNSFISRYPSNVDIKKICCTVWWYQIYSIIYGCLRKVLWYNIIPLKKDRTIRIYWLTIAHDNERFII